MKFEDCSCFSCNLACNDYECEHCRRFGDCSACKFSNQDEFPVAPADCNYAAEWQQETE